MHVRMRIVTYRILSKVLKLFQIIEKKTDLPILVTPPREHVTGVRSTLIGGTSGLGEILGFERPNSGQDYCNVQRTY